MCIRDSIVVVFVQLFLAAGFFHFIGKVIATHGDAIAALETDLIKA